MIVPLIDFVASLDFLSPDEGGRVMPVASGYRPQFHLSGASADCRLEFEEEGALPTGQVHRASVQLMDPERFGESLRPGATFTLREASRIYARGIIEHMSGQEKEKKGVRNR
jgi:translation elongation factor EF-Tu-like GTPase